MKSAKEKGRTKRPFLFSAKANVSNTVSNYQFI